jgi:hypothetical protein
MKPSDVGLSISACDAAAVVLDHEVDRSPSVSCAFTRVALACRATLVSSSWKMRKMRRGALLVGIGKSARDVHRAADAGAALELARLPLDRRGEPDLVEHLGTQPRGDAAHRVDDAVDRLRQRLLAPPSRLFLHAALGEARRCRT